MKWWVESDFKAPKKAIKKIPGCMTYVVHPEIGKLNNLEVFESK
jgi:hypothetical protein